MKWKTKGRQLCLQEGAPAPGSLPLNIFFLWVLIFILAAPPPGVLGLSPSIKGLTNLRRELVVGEDLLLTCVVRNIGSHTVIWSKVFQGRKKILTIDRLRVLPDPRITVLHDQAPNYNSSVIIPGGDVWVLSVKNVTLDDAGGYMCRVNSEPPAQNYYMVQVKDRDSLVGASPPVRAAHNYTACCLDNLVDPKCLGFCSLSDILEGRTGIEPEKCEAQFPSIVKCMADLRDHRPCCERQGIPDICQDLCRGEYTVQDDFVKSHFSCATFTEATLLCISEGIQLLPMAPRIPSVVIEDPFTLRVEWLPPGDASPPVQNYVVNVTTLVRFTPSDSNDDSLVTSLEPFDSYDDFGYVSQKTQILSVPSNATQVKVGGLTPMTWYEVSVKSSNAHGSSISPYNIRALTIPDDRNLTHKPVEPELPDIIGCCISKGVKHERCLQNLCNPNKRYIEEPDMIVCAAWTEETFGCLTGGRDLGDCCRQRGLPEICVRLCAGNVTKIDYNYFRCVDYFSDFRSCLLEGYGVLPSAPLGVAVTSAHPTFALLKWSPPAQNAASVTSYHAYYRPMDGSRDCSSDTFLSYSGLSYLGVQVRAPPIILENLCEDSLYEVYVEAFNKHGTSAPSQRIIFWTPRRREQRPLGQAYNATECCRAVNLSPGCLPLCGYNVRMSHYRALSATCTPEMSKVFRCIVGGRDHSSCCERRGVPVSCLSLCTGAFRGDTRTPTGCLPYLGNIMMCLEEGTDTLPGPVRSLHATEIADGRVTLQWEPPEAVGANASSYQVHYQEVDKYSATHAVLKLNNTLNTTDPFAVVTGLKNGSLYNVFVLAINEWGSSLPSSILTINASTTEGGVKVVAGVPSAPHTLMLEAKAATSLTLLWQPPIVASPTDRIRYTIHYAALTSLDEDPTYNTTTTSTTAHQLSALTPNTQYIIYITAMNDMGESRPSETLLAWTDPAYPAFVEMPTVHPNNLIVEGGSMTVLCIAMGSPPPNVSLYISGVLIHQDVTRHMVTIVKNVSRSMTDISCFADNGYGTPMQSSITITVSHRPLITANEEVRAVAGEEVTLECLVSAWPPPSLFWFKDPINRVPVVNGGNVSISTKNVSKGQYLMTLTLDAAEDADFYCHASNSLGSYTHTVKVRAWEEVRQPLDVSACCANLNVNLDCVSACDFGTVDFHKKMNSASCIPDFPKLLECAADRSDHRGCCSKKGVPAHCLDWCRAKSLPSDTDTQHCLLWLAPLIFACFEEGKENLPGPPEDVRFQSLSLTSAQISWQPPIKSSDKVEKYRVFWREKGTRLAFKNDTTETSLQVYNLTEGNVYEVAVKAGNRLGTSVLTETRVFTHRIPYINFLSTKGSNPTGVAVGICLGVLMLAGVAAMGWYAVRRRQLLSKGGGGGGISFENPSYVREQSGDAVQIAETPNGSLHADTSPPEPLTNGRLPNGGSSHPPSVPDGDEPPNGSGWNANHNHHATPGFEDDLDPKGGYKRFKS